MHSENEPNLKTVINHAYGHEIIMGMAKSNV